jgi:hypothetical protein
MDLPDRSDQLDRKPEGNFNIERFADAATQRQTTGVRQNQHCASVQACESQRLSNRIKTKFIR